MIANRYFAIYMTTMLGTVMGTAIGAALIINSFGLVAGIFAVLLVLSVALRTVLPIFDGLFDRAWEQNG